MALELTLESILPTAIGLAVTVVGAFAARSVKALDETVGELRSDMREMTHGVSEVTGRLMVVVERLDNFSRRIDSLEHRVRRIERIGIFDDTK